MIANAFYAESFSCFTASPIGFDAFTPITVVIGKNNTGKSKLLDFVQTLCECKIDTTLRTHGVVMLDEQSLRSIFSENTRGGELGSYSNHWADHGMHLVGCEMSWQSDSTGRAIVTIPSERHHGNKQVQKVRESYLSNGLRGIATPFTKKHFRRILADRDIRTEPPSYETKVAPDGTGATNTVRRFLTSSELDEPLVRVKLLQGMQQIFGSDAVFNRIEIKQHDSKDNLDSLWEIFFEEPGKGLVPLGQSGSGLKTVLLVLLNLIVMPAVENKSPSDYIFAFEELENNLHPSLLRRLFDFITEYVSHEKCYLLLTTHSSVALDYFGTHEQAQIIRVSHDGNSATAAKVEAHFDRVGLIAELGAKPSDLLQANGVVWVEGPSDRIYINRLIDIFSDGKVREGRDYQCAFYGGSLLACVQACEPEQEVEELSNLLRLNNNIAVVCDGDRTSSSGSGAELKPRVKEMSDQVASTPGAYIWITEAKEIECYVPSEVWNLVYGKKSLPSPGVYDSFPSAPSEDTHYVFREIKRKSFDKFAFSQKAAPLLTKELLKDRFEVQVAIEKLITCIEQWNV